MGCLALSSAGPGQLASGPGLASASRARMIFSSSQVAMARRY